MDIQIPQPPTQSNPELVSQPPAQTAPPVNTAPIETHHTPPIVIVLLIIFFAPLAVYFMWKEKRYQKWVAILLIFFGSTLTLLFLVTDFIKISASQNATSELTLPIGTFIIFSITHLIFTTPQLFLGIYSYRKVKTNSYPPIWLLILTVIFLFLDFYITIWQIIGLSMSKSAS